MAGAYKAVKVAQLLGASVILSQLSFALTCLGAQGGPVLADLETRIWNGEESSLSHLENEVVRGIQDDPTSVYAHYLLAHVYVRRFSQTPGEMQVLKTASELAEQAVELDPASDLGYLAMADILDLMGQTSKAVALITTAEKTGMVPSWRLHFHMARLQIDSISTEEVLALLEKAMQAPKVREDIVVPYVIAVLQSAYQGANLLTMLAAWNNRFPNPLFKQNLAVCLTDLSRHRDAHLLYQQLQKEHPEIKEAAVNDAILLYRHLDQPGEAIRMLEKTLASRYGEFEPQQLATVKAHLGAAYVRIKNFDRAREAYLQSFRHAKGNVALLDFVSASYRTAKQYGHLVEFMNQLSREQKGIGHAYALLGQTLSENLNRHQDAIAAYDNAIVLDPQRSDFYTGMGLAFYRLDKLDKALDQFATATRVDPNDATARYNQACVLARLGKSDEALNSLQEALNLDPRLAETARSDLDFAGVKSSTRFQAMIRTTPGIGDEPKEMLSH